MHDGTIRGFSEVRYVPDIKKNLLTRSPGRRNPIN